MTNYESIVPEKIETNTFDFHGASIVIEGDYNSYRGFTIKDLSNFFYGDKRWYTSSDSIYHFIEIKSSKPLVINRFDFTTITSAKFPENFKIESSMDDETWNTVYTGIASTASSKNEYVKLECEFKPTVCKYLKFTISRADQASGVFHGLDGKIYGALSTNQNPFLYTNPDVYGILKKEE